MPGTLTRHPLGNPSARIPAGLMSLIVSSVSALLRFSSASALHLGEDHRGMILSSRLPKKGVRGTVPNKFTPSPSTFSRGCRGAAAAVLALAMISGSSAAASVAATTTVATEMSVPAAKSLKKIPHWLSGQVPMLAQTRGGIGDLVMAYYDIWKVGEVVAKYQWYRDGRKIEGDTGSAHTLVAADKGKKLHVVMTGSKDGFAPTKVVAGSMTFDFTLTFHGKPSIINPSGGLVGMPLFANADYARTVIAGVAEVKDFSYQWRRDGQAIRGATSDTYDMTLQDLGKKLSVTVTPLIAGYTSNSSTSAATAPVVDASVINGSKPIVTGTAKVGRKLTATRGKWNANAKTFSYQWYANGVAIQGATASSYTITASIVGKKLTVQVTARGAYMFSTASSAPSAAVRRI